MNGRSQTLYSVAAAAGITNINPLANLATALANGADLANLYALPDPAKLNTVVQALPNAISKVQEAFQPTLVKFGAEALNFVSAPYSANHEGLDLFLDMADISINSANVAIVDRTVNDPYTARTNMPLSNIAPHSVNIISDPSTAIHSVIVNPNPAVVAPNVTLYFSSEVIGSANQQVAWSAIENNGGAITNTGVYTAPASPGVYHITATSVLPTAPTRVIEVTVSVSQKNVLSVISSGTGTYTVMADNLTDVSGMDFTLRYDPATLANPRVASGALTAGALFAQNTSSLGQVRFALISRPPLSGSGPLATISFDTPTSPGKILSISATAIDSTGRVVGTVVQFSPPV